MKILSYFDHIPLIFDKFVIFLSKNEEFMKFKKYLKYVFSQMLHFRIDDFLHY